MKPKAQAAKCLPGTACQAWARAGNHSPFLQSAKLLLGRPQLSRVFFTLRGSMRAATWMGLSGGLEGCGARTRTGPPPPEGR